MGFFNNALEVKVEWSIQHRWQTGRELDWPSLSHSLWLMLEGEAAVWSGEKCWTVQPGQIFLWPKNLPRRIVAIKESHWLSIGLTATSPSHPDLLSLLRAPGLHTPQPEERLPIVKWMENLLELDDYEFAPQGLQELSGNWKKPDKLRPPHFNLIEDCMARAIFGWCWGAWGTTDLNAVLTRKLPSWLLNTLERIQLEPTVSVSSLSAMAGFSPAQFRRLFHQNMYESPQRYLLTRRLEAAQRMLEESDLPVAEIARRCGFPTPTNFMTMWKRTRGLSALQYRMIHQSMQHREI